MHQRPHEGGCSTVIVGRAASITGRILIGHNEDNGGRVITNRLFVPAREHAEGERIAFEPGTAEIPLPARSLGYCWSETITPEGAAYSDTFVNEAGVIIVSNSCSRTWEKDESVNDGGVGYAVRRIVAMRARTACEAVQITIRLQERYGYVGEGRTYTFADANEAWQMFLLRGHRWAARRVRDDEVVFTANAFALDRVNDVPPGDILLSPDLIRHATETGRYIPETGRDYSDFSFRRAYQPSERRFALWNFDRARTAWAYLTGMRITDPERVPYAAKPQLKLSVRDVMHVLSARSDTEDRPGFGPSHRTMRDISNVGTYDATVFEMDEEPLLITGWRVPGRPSALPFVPFFPLGGPAESEAVMPAAQAEEQHFHAPAEVFDFRPDRPLWKFLMAQTLADWLEGDPRIYSAYMESCGMGETAEVQKTARMLLSRVSREKAAEVLHDFNERAWAAAVGAMSAAFEAMSPARIAILSGDLSTVCAEDDTVTVALFPRTGMDPAKIDPGSVSLGTVFPTLDMEWHAARARVTAMSLEDIDGDGRLEALFTFPKAAILRQCIPGVRTDLWLFGLADGEPFGGVDAVRVFEEVAAPLAMEKAGEAGTTDGQAGETGEFGEGAREV
ncbi:C69 family dipeptidase [Sutterella sp.]|uniref:C69 family dipeptidase n=1 Tax=Sutterella sp. TaxID=1981025 RepID=UPI0026DEC119|nr:C69 family dipeptidase [Sutterella sp.]MDO5530925.1 C69 family dipeptidase [Sutterella sp.]